MKHNLTNQPNPMIIIQPAKFKHDNLTNQTLSTDLAYHPNQNFFYYPTYQTIKETLKLFRQARASLVRISDLLN